MKLLRFLIILLSPLLLWTAAGCGGGGGGGLSSTETKLTGQWVAEKLNVKGDRIMLTFNSGSATTTLYGSSTGTTTKDVVITAIQSTGDEVSVDSGTYTISGGTISFQLTDVADFESPFTLSTASLTLGTEVYTKSAGSLGGPVLGGQIVVSQASADQSVTTGALRVTSSVPRFVPGQILILNSDTAKETTSQSGLSIDGAAPSGENMASYKVVNIKLDDEASSALSLKKAPSSISEHVARVTSRRDALRKKTYEESLKCKPNCVLNRFVRTQSLSAPTDTEYKDQWNLEAMDITDAWGIAAASTDVVVAVIDTGIVEHPDLAGRVLKKSDGTFMGYDFIQNATDGIPDLDLDSTSGPDSDPTDPGDQNRSLGLPGGSSWHGTHIAGIICAAIDNAVGIAGVTSKCKILPIRTMGFEGNGTLVDVAEGIRYAAKLSNVAECTYDGGTGTYSGCHIDARPKANIINLSLGAPMTSDEADILNRAIDAAVAQGVLVVAASGNQAKGPGWCIDDDTGDYVSNSSCAFYPAANPNVLSVGAVVANLKFASGYSNFGGGPTNSQFLAAPGGSGSQAILSTVNPSVTVSSTEAGYAELMGTSQAAAHVSGVAAQVWSEIASAPGLPVAQPVKDIKIRDWVKTALSSSAVDLGNAGRDILFGHGLVNACGAIVRARQLAGLPPPSAATTVQLSSTRVNFGPLATTHTDIIYGCGATPATVTTATKHVDSGDAGWFDVRIVGATTPAQMTVTVNRAGLAAGDYTGTVTVNTSVGSKVLNVAMRVGSASIAGGEDGTDDDLRGRIEGALGGVDGGEVEKENTIDLGEVILLLIDAETGKVLTNATTGQPVGAITDLVSDYNFQISGIPPGTYYLLAGVDENEDGIICNSAEAEPCFAYPSLADPEVFEVETSTRKTDLVLNYSP